MKSILDYRSGDLVVIVDADELYEIFELYEIDVKEALGEETVEAIACQRGKICKAPKDLIAEDRDWDGLVPIFILSSQSIVRLSIGAFIDEEDIDFNNVKEFMSTRQSNISELISYDDSDDEPDNREEDEPIIVRHAPSEELMIQLLAVETIQSAFRYRRTC